MSESDQAPLMEHDSLDDSWIEQRRGYTSSDEDEPLSGDEGKEVLYKDRYVIMKRSCMVVRRYSTLFWCRDKTVRYEDITCVRGFETLSLSLWGVKDIGPAAKGIWWAWAGRDRFSPKKNLVMTVRGERYKIGFSSQDRERVLDLFFQRGISSQE